MKTLPTYTVWSIFDNAYVTLSYWEWVNNRDNSVHNARLGNREEERAANPQEHSESTEE